MISQWAVKFSSFLDGAPFVVFVLNIVLFIEASTLLVAVVWPWLNELFNHFLDDSNMPSTVRINTMNVLDLDYTNIFHRVNIDQSILMRQPVSVQQPVPPLSQALPPLEEKKTEQPIIIQVQVQKDLPKPSRLSLPKKSGKS